MHSLQQRGNANILHALIGLTCLIVACFTNSKFQDFHSQVDMRAVTVSVRNLQAHNGLSEYDLGFLTFDLQTNLSHLFKWNVKQLFVYLTAEYRSAHNQFNQILLWDKIIRKGEDAAFDFENTNIKYYFWDDGNVLKNNNISLMLSWNIVPNIGLLPHIHSSSDSFRFPAEYTTSKA